MTKLLEQMNKIKDEILAEKNNSLLFFALFSRNDSKIKKDLVISADWIEDGNTRSAVKYLIEKIKKHAADEEELIDNVVAFSTDENFIHHIALAYREGRTERIESITKIKLFDDYVISAVVLHESFKNFEIKTIKKKSTNKQTVAF